MQITIAVSTDESELTLKRSFTITQDKRDACIQAAVTLLNVSMSVVEELERKEAAKESKCSTCEHFDGDIICSVCLNTVINDILRETSPCRRWRQKE